jgi:hypothetical protein
MLSAVGPGGHLLHHNLRASVGQWVDCCGVVGKVVESASSSDDPVGEPHGRRQEQNNDDLLPEVGLVEAGAHDSDDEEAYVHHVKQLVPDGADHKCRYRDAQKSEACNDSSNLFLLDQQCPLVSTQEEGTVTGGVYDHADEGQAAGDLM